MSERKIYPELAMATLTLRYMQIADIPQVSLIDNLSFDTPWSQRSFVYEISESTYSHMVVLERAAHQPNGRWQGWVQRLFGQPTLQRQIVGFGGLWNIAGEGHISTIATHPQWRGRGYGEILLAAMIRRALSLEAEYVVLEVRVSNAVAQNLYQKYEFRIFDIKPKYYRNNNEDAYDMRLDLSDEVMITRFDRRYADLAARIPFMDHYTTVPLPRR